MVTKIFYTDIKNLKPEEAVDFLDSVKKFSVKEATLLVVLNEKSLGKPLLKTYYWDLSPRGIYLFYNVDNQVRYIGQTNQSFYSRLMTQFDTTYYPGFGWNSMLKIMGCKRTGKGHDELNEEEHEIDLKEVCEFRLLLIDVGSSKNVNASELIRLEKTLLKTYREMHGEEKLLNNRIGWLRPIDWKTSIDNLIRLK